uniref:SMP-30/Gluconolactonase/LRE-like region domain-containing protein n=1 Tax=Cryptomonas curvata TaxID=233186 RepID=A0A7S0QYN1_9CRYP
MVGVVGLRTGSIIGERGSGPGQLRTPAALAIDTEGRVFVADRGNHRIQVFRADGLAAGSFGSEGSGPGQFRGPCGVALDRAGRLLVVDGGNRRVQVFSPDGIFLSSFGTPGCGEGQFKEPRGIAVEAACTPPSSSSSTEMSSGLIFVADWGNSRIQAFTADGRFVRFIGCPPTCSGEDILSASAAPVDGLLKSPYGVGTCLDGTVLVADTANHRVQVFRPDGCWLRSFGAFGAESGQLKYPNAVAADASGRVVVSDNWNHRVQVISLWCLNNGVVAKFCFQCISVKECTSLS